MRVTWSITHIGRTEPCGTVHIARVLWCAYGLYHIHEKIKRIQVHNFETSKYTLAKMKYIIMNWILIYYSDTKRSKV